MGCCISNQVVTKIDQHAQVKVVDDEINTVNKVLILGAYRSGKTTLRRHLQYIYSDGFDGDSRKQFRAPIWEQMIDAMNIMIQVLTNDNHVYKAFDDEKERKQTLINPELQESVDFITRVAHQLQKGFDTSYARETAQHMERLWNDKAIQTVFDKRNKICISDSTEYFMKTIKRIFDENYVPTDEDILLVRYRSSGFAERTFEMGPKPDIFKIVDVGGIPNGL